LQSSDSNRKKKGGVDVLGGGKWEENRARFLIRKTKPNGLAWEGKFLPEPKKKEGTFTKKAETLQGGDKTRPSVNERSGFKGGAKRQSMR